MALSKDQKAAVISNAQQMLEESKLIIVARYGGTSVQALQNLRAIARKNSSQVRIVKNRLVKTAMAENDTFRNADSSFLTGQLMYAFSDSDEVAPARVIADFRKVEPQVEFVAGLTAEGAVMAAEDVVALATLPTKEQLRAQLAGLIASPLSGFTSTLAGNVRGVLNVLSSRAESI